MWKNVASALVQHRALQAGVREICCSDYFILLVLVHYMYCVTRGVSLNGLEHI